MQAHQDVEPMRRCGHAQSARTGILDLELQRLQDARRLLM